MPAPQGLLLDLDGTVYAGRTLVPGAAAAITALRGAGIPFLFTTNTSRKSRADVVTSLAEMGLAASQDEILTAPVAAAAWLETQGIRRVQLLVSDSTHADFTGLELTEDQPEAVLVGDLGAAATGSQQVLDRLPGAGAADLRKNRSILNNIILTTTGAAKALSLVIPEMEKIGFMAESVRIPTSSGSLIILVLNLQDELDTPTKRADINSIYREFSEVTPYLEYTEQQNVSSDILGTPRAAAVIEASETHTRTAAIPVNLGKVKGATVAAGADPVLNVPVTQAVVYGWYDNELGSYTNMLGDLTVKVADEMV